MISIYDISWREFKLEVNKNPTTVGDLYQLSEQYNDELFVYHETATRFSAVIIPELVKDTIESYDMDHASLANAVGLTDILKREQMTVDQNQTASAVARQATDFEFSQVIVVDENLKPVGIFIPAHVFNRLPGTLNTNQIIHLSPTIQGLLNLGFQQGGLDKALEEIEKVKDSYHAETLNYHDPEVLVCHAKGRTHSTFDCPCQRDGHSSSPCGKRNIARQ